MTTNLSIYQNNDIITQEIGLFQAVFEDVECMSSVECVLIKNRASINLKLNSASFSNSIMNLELVHVQIHTYIYA